MALTDQRAGTEDLIVLGSHQGTREYLRELWARRHFAYSLADNDLRSKHMNSVLGQLWHLLNPALMIFIYFLIFGVVLDARRGVENYVSFLVVGVVVFRYTQNTTLGASQCITRNLGLIRSIQFPRALVPVSVVLENLMALIPALGLVIVVALVDGADLGLRTMLLPPVVLVGALFTAGIGFIAARAGSALTDLTQVLPHFFRIMFYMSGVLFDVKSAISNPTIQDLFALNPFYCLVASARWSLMGYPLTTWELTGLFAWTLVALVGGFHYFRRAEHRFGA